MYLPLLNSIVNSRFFYGLIFGQQTKKKITMLLITTLRGLVLQYYYLLLRELFAIFRDKKFHFNFNLTLPRCYILQMFYNIGKVFAGIYIYGGVMLRTSTQPIYILTVAAVAQHSIAVLLGLGRAQARLEFWLVSHVF